MSRQDTVNLLLETAHKLDNTELSDLKNEISELEKSMEVNKFDCIRCKNEHEEILNWLKELLAYKEGRKPQNKEDLSAEGYISLTDAITHTQDVLETHSLNANEKMEHLQLLNWLEELQKYRSQE